MVLVYFRYLMIQFICVLLRFSGLFQFFLYLNRKKAKLIILNYHNFSKYNNYKFKRGSILETDFKTNFEKQIIFYKKHFFFIEPKHFYSGIINNNNNLHITFDDGYKDNFQIALSILKKHKIKATFFIVTNSVGSNEWLLHDRIRYLVLIGKLEAKFAEESLKDMNLGKPLPKLIIDKVNNFDFPTNKPLMMNLKELIQIQTSGFKIQPHTHNHSILSFLDYESQKNEIEKSINYIQTNLGFKSDSFAYPNGLYNGETVNLMKSFNISFAYTTKPGLNYEQTDNLQLKRIGVNVSDNIGLIILKILINFKR